MFSMLLIAECHENCMSGCSDGTALGCDACKEGYHMGPDGCEGMQEYNRSTSVWSQDTD